MPALDILAALTVRQARRLPTPFERRRHHHRLRRARVDARAHDAWWGDDPRWYPGGTPPRQHNRVTPLVDGEAYFDALCTAIEGARDYVYVAGWGLTPYIPLRRHGRDELARTRLLDLLTETARRASVRVLLWGGSVAPLPPTQEQVEDVCRTIETRARDAHGDIVCRLDRTAHPTHCHHQKAVVVDGQAAFVGGMDLTTLQGDRWDTTDHPLRVGPNWHDAQLRIEGEAVADVEHNFRQRWQGADQNHGQGRGEDDLPHRDPAYDPAWRTPAQIVRTIPAHVYRSVPRGEYGIHHAYIHALWRARRLVYLENQYLWSDDIMDALVAAITKPREDPFRVVIVLPAHADRGKWDNDRQVSRLRELDAGRGIVSIYSPYASGPGRGLSPFTYRPTYVHAKVAIIDDEWLTVGSANLNNRGLVTDSEINAVVRDPVIARDLRIDLWAEHLALPRDEVARADPIDLLDRVWAHRARQNAERVNQGDSMLVCPAHPYDVGRMPGAWLLEESEALTFEL